jgi:hypothetical protein
MLEDFFENMKNIANFVFWSSLLFVCSSSILAQSPNVEPKLVDQFNRIVYEFAEAKMDILFQELKRNPNAKAYVIVYGAASECIFENSKNKQGETKRVIPHRGLAKRRINFYRNYLTKVRELEPSRLILIDGGFKEKETTEFWLVEKGQTPPKPQPTVDEKNIKFRKGNLKKQDILGEC